MHLLHLSFEMSSACTVSQILFRVFIRMSPSSLWIRFVKLESGLAINILDFHFKNLSFPPILWPHHLAQLLRLWHVSSANHGCLVLSLDKLLHTPTNAPLSCSHATHINRVHLKGYATELARGAVTHPRLRTALIAWVKPRRYPMFFSVLFGP